MTDQPRGSEQDITIPPSEGRPFTAQAGQFITVVDVDGQQVADFVALNAAEHKERLSTCYTRTDLRRIYVREGDTMKTNLRRPIFEIVEDQVGQHDITVAACDPQRYEQSYGIPGHANCLDNLSQALSTFGIDRWSVPEPFNIFQHTIIEPDGTMTSHEPRSKAGDRIVLRALMDVVGAVSACANELSPTNAHNLTSIRVLVTDTVPEPSTKVG
jgi:uncharacterized protein